MARKTKIKGLGSKKASGFVQGPALSMSKGSKKGMSKGK